MKEMGGWSKKSYLRIYNMETPLRPIHRWFEIMQRRKPPKPRGSIFTSRKQQVRRSVMMQIFAMICILYPNIIRRRRRWRDGGLRDSSTDADNSELMSDWWVDVRGQGRQSDHRCVGENSWHCLN